MRRRSIWSAISGAGLAVLGVARARAAENQGHRVVFHVGGPDPAMMRVALGNIVNVAKDFAARGQNVAIELVANGPGYAMLRADRSPVAAGVAAVQKQYPFVVFSACQNSRAGEAAAEAKSPLEIPELPGMVDVPAGVVRLMELQAQGWSYIRV